MNLEDITLVSTSQSPADKDCVIPLMRCTWSLSETEWFVVARGSARRKWGVSHRVAVVLGEEFCGWTVVGVAKQCGCT